MAGLRKMTVLKKTAEVAVWRTGCDPSHERKLPGGSKYEPITLEQGLTHDSVIDKNRFIEKAPWLFLLYRVGSIALLATPGSR